jgi:beta-galactosidase
MKKLRASFNGKSLLFLFSIAFLVAFSEKSALAQGRNITRMNAGWKFMLADDQTFSDSALDDSNWRILDLPHDWSMEGRYDKSNPSGPQGGYFPCGTGWYRKSFTLPEADRGRRVFIRFDGVYMNSSVWINNRMVGSYPNGYNSFEYDITPFVRFGEGAHNAMAVRVDNSLQPGSRWYNGSGIYRNVWLITTGQLHFKQNGVFVATAKATKEEAIVHVDYHIIANAFPETVFSWTDNTSLFIWVDKKDQQMQKPNNRIGKMCTILSIIRDQDLHEVARQVAEHQIGDFTEPAFTQELSVKNPKLWSSRTPVMYTLESSIYCDGKLADRVNTPIGLRNIEFTKDRGMLVNGEQEKIKGICLHQSMGCLGVAYPARIWYERLKKLKDMGCNAIRVGTYPFSPEFYTICDTMGFYVMNEIFDEWNRGQEWGYSETSYGKLPYTYHLYFDQWYDTDLRSMIRRDRNHPCVLLYCIGNEIPNQRIDGIEIARKLKGICHEEDPGRPVTAACDFFVGANVYGFMDVPDIAGYNYIDRIHPALMYAAEKEKYPDRLFLGTETYHKAPNWISVRDHDYVIGEFVWVGYDYLGEIAFPGLRGWNAGMLDIAGFPKPEYYLRKSYWSPQPVAYIAVEHSKGRIFDWSPRDVIHTWNWEQKGDTALRVFVYSNCEEAELILNNKSLGRKTINPDSCFAIWEVPFKAGELKSIGFNGKKKVATDRLRTVSGATNLHAGCDRKNITPGYDDAVIAEIEVRDKNGLRVPDAENDISLDLVGPGELLGSDNGNQYDPQGIKYVDKYHCRAFEGRMTAVIRATAAQGEIKLKAVAPGLAPCELTLTIVNP